MNTPDLVKHPTITATGTKGYLQWLKSDPGLGPVYEQNKNRIAGVLGITQNTSGYQPIVSAAEAALSGFGSYTFGKPRSRYLPTVERMPGLNGLTGLGQDDSLYDSSDVLTPDNVSLSAANLDTELSAPDLSTVATSLPTINDTVTSSAPVTPTSATAASQLQSIIGAAATAATTALNISNAQQINQIQLQRAQQGLSPLNLSTTGAPGLNAINFTSALPLLLIGAVVVFAMSSGSKRKS